MSIAVILALIASGLALGGLGWQISSYVALALALALLIGIGCGPLAALLVEGLQRGYPAHVTVQPARVTAIVLLGNGTEEVGTPPSHTVEVGPLGYGRIVKALELYRACKQVNTGCFVLISGGDPRRHGVSEATIYGAQLTRLGVAPGDLVLEDRSLNTFQNAQYSASVLAARSPDQVFLVSSGLHLRRALTYFAHFGSHPRPVGVDFVSATPSVLPLAHNFLVADLGLHEYEGVLRYMIYERMGWNVPAPRPHSP